VRKGCCKKTLVLTQETKKKLFYECERTASFGKNLFFIKIQKVRERFLEMIRREEQP